MVILNICGARAILYYFGITKTLNLRNKKLKLAYIYQFFKEINIKVYMRHGCPFYNIEDKHIVVIINITGAIVIFYYLCLSGQ